MGDAVILPPVELQVFASLLEKFPDPVANELLLSAAGGITSRNFDVRVARLRKKIAPLSIGIKTIHGEAHRMVFWE